MPVLNMTVEIGAQERDFVIFEDTGPIMSPIN